VLGPASEGLSSPAGRRPYEGNPHFLAWNGSQVGLGDIPKERPFSIPMSEASYIKQWWSFTDDSVPSEARKRGSGGGSPRKYDDLLTSDLDVLV
jgi:hypothetical protein